MEKILCPNCRRDLIFQDRAVLDDNYTLWHSKCFSDAIFQIKDKGPIIDIIEKYSVFHELLPIT